MVRQTQEPAHLLGVIADHADRVATEARRLCRRDEGFERNGRIDLYGGNLAMSPHF